MSNKIALITGITGQDGSFLAEFLLEKDIAVGYYPDNLLRCFFSAKAIFNFGILTRLKSVVKKIVGLKK